ncbi:MAG: 3-oxoacyl-ACP synthase [Flavobacteriales bacterium]|nr:3-oxoacyl-ACP synthase [Flavobacteriales bacterium]
MDKPVNKADLLDRLQALLDEKVNSAQLEIASLRGSFTSDTKSSAGDKHEVGRAMVQQESDKLEEQLAKLIALRQELTRVPLERTFDRVAFGSLVGTDQGTYFVAIGLGRIDLDGGTCFAISLASPMGQVLKDRRIGEQVTFNGKVIEVQRIE